MPTCRRLARERELVANLLWQRPLTEIHLNFRRGIFFSDNINAVNHVAIRQPVVK